MDQFDPISDAILGGLRFSPGSGGTRWEQAATRLKQHVIAAFERARTRKMAGNCHALSLSYNAPAVDVLDPDAVPERYKLHEVTERTSIDKRAIKAVMANGDFVPGIRLTQTISLIRS
jgi:hypothetical protein